MEDSKRREGRQRDKTTTGKIKKKTKQKRRDTR